MSHILTKVMLACPSCFESPKHGLYSCIKNLEFHKKYFSNWGISHICIFNDGNNNLPIENIFTLFNENEIPSLLETNKINIFYSNKRLGRSGVWTYPGLWNNIYTMIKIGTKYNFDKIIYMEPDFFIFSEKMSNYIESITKGITAFYCPSFKQPEPALQIICKDSFEKYKRLVLKIAPYQHNIKNTTEWGIDWTLINKDFIGDRWGEQNISALPERFDFIAQLPINKTIENQKIKNWP